MAGIFLVALVHGLPSNRQHTSSLLAPDTVPGVNTIAAGVLTNSTTEGEG